jgi:hypothetical protein
MTMPGFTAGQSLVHRHVAVSNRKIHEGLRTPQSASVVPSLPKGDINPGHCIPECAAECMDAGGDRETCFEQCRKTCFPPPPPITCRDEPDPNYGICVGGIIAWQAACIADTFVLGLGSEFCHSLANQMLTQCTQTRRVCD